MYPSSITESCDNSVKQVIVASGSVSLLVDIMFCNDKRLEGRGGAYLRREICVSKSIGLAL